MKRLLKTLVVTATVAASMVVTMEAAHAGVGISTSLSGPSAAAVGQTGLAGSVTAINTNTPPNQAESNVLTTVKVALSCGAVPAPPNPCPNPDLGVFSMAPSATGAAATACAGVAFTASAPDASGTVTFTTGSTVILGPPGGSAGSDRCTVNYTFNVLKVPTIDVDAGTAGVQTRTNARLQVTSSPSGLMPAGNPTLLITVVAALPTIATVASPSAVTLGGAVSDTATVTGAAGIASPTGTVTFRLYGPSDATCSSVAVFSSTNVLTGGTAVSSNFVPVAVGVYRFTAAYSGDVNYQPRMSLCNEANESVVVTAAPVNKSPADFDGDGDTDVSVFRPSNSTWYTLGGSPGAIAFGATGDVPVPADYDGDGNVDEAVFRPSSNTWYLRTASPQAIAWGATGDIPVPGDYDGNGTADIAVFRPSNGTWFIRTPAQSIAWGASGDIPVPGDYDGNGTTDLAVYRPATSAWYLRTAAPSSPVWGTTGDIPVPGDYDGNGTVDVAVFRPSNGTWFLRTPSPQSISWGTTGDVPSPGNYDGTGPTDLAVFRPSTNVWYVRTPAPTSPTWGAAGDVPLPLPNAISRFFF